VRPQAEAGGAERVRTDDLLNANQALSQLSYSPVNPECSLSLDSPRATPDSAQPQTYHVSRPVGRTSTHQARRLKAILIQTPSGEPEARASSSIAGSKPGPDGARLEWNGCHLLVSVAPPTFSLRKEVIQPQVLLRLPCYDFTPIMSHTLGRCSPCGLARRLLVQPTFVM
jgi:hypothetical protein